MTPQKKELPAKRSGSMMQNKGWIDRSKTANVADLRSNNFAITGEYNMHDMLYRQLTAITEQAVVNAARFEDVLSTPQTEFDRQIERDRAIGEINAHFECVDRRQTVQDGPRVAFERLGVIQ
jgi:hypothetical protein